MQQQQQTGAGKLMREHSPRTRQILGLITLLVGAVAVLCIGGLMLGGIALAFVIGIPVFLFFSPVLVPLGIVAFLTISGIAIACTAAITFLSFVAWVYKYARGRHPVGADKIDAARHRIMSSVQQATEKGRDVAGQAASKAQEAAPGA